jgi:hypothetical protein
MIHAAPYPTESIVFDRRTRRGAKPCTGWYGAKGGRQTAIAQPRPERPRRIVWDSRTPQEKILLALAEYEYLTAEQLTRLLYAPASLTHVRDLLRAFAAESLVLVLPSPTVTSPKIYTLASKGSSILGKHQRIRPSEEMDKTPTFLAHSLAVNDLLISAVLLAREVAGIRLSRMIFERELRGTLEAPLVPDAAVEFLLQDRQGVRWRYFFQVELYRYLPKKERFQKKVLGYVDLAGSGKQQERFGTTALAVAVCCPGEGGLARTLKGWTEEVLAKQPEEGQRFFFGSSDTAKPSELYLAPCWYRAFASDPTPLLLLEEEEGVVQ